MFIENSVVTNLSCFARYVAVFSEPSSIACYWNSSPLLYHVFDMNVDILCCLSVFVPDSLLLQLVNVQVLSVSGT